MIRPINVKNQQGELLINNHSFYELKEKYQTPLYIIDERQLMKNINIYQTTFISKLFQTQIVYASKALLNFEIVRIMQREGLMMDAVSMGDLYVINKAIGNLKTVVFHGNNKSKEELIFALENNIGIIVVDNLQELYLLNELTNKLNCDAKIMIRVNPHVETHTHKFIQTSKVASKFGISIDHLDEFSEIKKITSHNQHLVWVGLHAHIGSNIFEEASFYEEINKMVDFINYLNNTMHISLNELNLGGGIGVRYNLDDPNIKLDQFLANIITYLEAEICKTHSLINKVYVEPGRSIVANAGMTLYTISQIKNSDVKNYLFIDGGMNDNIRKALYDAKYTAEVISKVNEEKIIKADVVGKCCESGDLIIEDGMFPKIQEGDLLLVYTTGAYNHSMASNYNNLLVPAMVLVGDEIKLIVKRQEFSDLVKQFQ